MNYFDKHKTYFMHLTNERAIEEWKTFAHQLKRGMLEWYDYWQTLSLRESFDNDERTLTQQQREEVEQSDTLVLEHLYHALVKHNRFEEYRNLGQKRPKEFWWWHVEENKQ